MVDVSVLPLILVLAATPQPARSSSTSLVLGRVIDAGNGRPIAGAIVTLHGSAAVPPLRSGGGLPISSAPHVMTNADGQFVARGLRKGALFLTVTKGGYVDATNAQRRPWGSGQPIQVVEGQRITDIEVRMWKHGVIAGTVIDEAGEPIVGARVQSFRRTFAAGRARYAAGAYAVTDDRGMYRLANLTPGDFKIAVTSTLVAVPTSVIDMVLQGTAGDAAREMGSIGAAVAPAGSHFALQAGTQTISLSPGTATPMPRADGSFLVYPTTFYAAATTATQARAVSVKSGEERGNVDLQMQPFRSVRVTGTVLAPPGFAANIPIRLKPAGNDELVPDLEAATTLSDSSGAFSFPSVPPGQYALVALRVPRTPVSAGDANAITIVRSGAVAISSSVAPAPGRSAPPPIPADATLCAEVPLAVGDVDVTNITLALRAGSRVSGRVEFDGSGERPDALTLANMRITLDPATDSRLPEGLGFVTGRIDENGPGCRTAPATPHPTTP